jgi:hydroxymethylbilane synthase
MKHRIVIGTRGSELALAQSRAVASLLTKAHPELECELRPMVTRGDESQARHEPLPLTGAKGLFTAELEEALLSGAIDCAVHSCKDLPVIESSDFVLGAVPKRALPHDVWISRKQIPFANIPPGSVVGTSSVRRRAQLLRQRQDLSFVTLRGNIDTRLRKLRDGVDNIEGMVLAAAGLIRLNRSDEGTEDFSPEVIVPAPAQGALAIQCCSQSARMREILSAIHHRESGIAIEAERAFVRALGASCNTPVGCLATIEGDKVHFLGECLSPNGEEVIRVSGQDSCENAEALGTTMGIMALQRGFRSFLPS